MRTLPLALLALAVVACDASSDGANGDGTGELTAALEPVYVDGAAAYKDEADGSCRVVLRSVGRTPYQGGYATTCEAGGTPNGPCVYVWDGVVDVDASRFDDVARVEVLVRTGTTQGAWYAFATTEASADNGYRRFSFRIDHYTPGAGMSFTSLNRTEIDLIPYLVLTDGTRVFDHNRVKEPLASYALRLGNGWAVQADDSCQPDVPPPVPEYVLSYPDFAEALNDGPVVAGGQMRVSYDARRLRETQGCLGSEGPASSTTVVADWRFDDGVVHQATVETYVESYGYACQGQPTPCVKAQSFEPVLDVPATATRVELWFHCVPGFSQGAEANWKYDSDFGANYVLPVSQPASAIDWAGGWELYNARAGQAHELPEPLDWTGYTNMGLGIQARVYVKGVTDQASPDPAAIQAFVESDLHECTPGGAVTRQPLELAAVHAGPYGADTLVRWGIESTLSRCPAGDYRYRFVFSRDGGVTVTPLGNAVDTFDPLAATTWRTLHSAPATH
jgi:hypothetical protein